MQPLERLPDLLATADNHLLPQRADAVDLVMPSKLTCMLASARPVVATAHPGIDLALVVQTCGLVVPPENATALAVAALLAWKIRVDACVKRYRGMDHRNNLACDISPNGIEVTLSVGHQRHHSPDWQSVI